MASHIWPRSAPQSPPDETVQGATPQRALSVCPSGFVSWDPEYPEGIPVPSHAKDGKLHISKVRQPTHDGTASKQRLGFEPRSVWFPPRLWTTTTGGLYHCWPTPPEDGGSGTTVQSLGCKARCSYFWGSRKSSQVRGRAVICPLALPIHRLPTQSQFSAEHWLFFAFPSHKLLVSWFPYKWFPGNCHSL